MKLKHLAVLLALSTMAADCPLGDSSPTNNNNDVIIGTWTLQSVNGDPLPADFDDNGGVVQITSGSATVNANATFTYSETWSSGTDVTSGAWSKNGSTYTFDPAEQAGEGAQTNGYATISGNTMTLTVSEPGEPTTVRVLVKN